MSRHPSIAALGFAAACVWVPADGDRFDVDGDGVPVQSDCNDANPEVSRPVALDGALACGDVIDADVVLGQDVLGILNCVHPAHAGDLIRGGWREQIYRFVSAVPTDVVITLETDAFLLGVDDPDTGGVALVANRGAACTLDACVAAVPVAPDEYLQAGTPTDRPAWSPYLDFHSAAGETWYVVVTGGRAPTGGEAPTPSPYRLTVDCGADTGTTGASR